MRLGYLGRLEYHLRAIAISSQPGIRRSTTDYSKCYRNSKVTVCVQSCFLRLLRNRDDPRDWMAARSSTENSGHSEYEAIFLGRPHRVISNLRSTEHSKPSVEPAKLRLSFSLVGRFGEAMRPTIRLWQCWNSMKSSSSSDSISEMRDLGSSTGKQVTDALSKVGHGVTRSALKEF